MANTYTKIYLHLVFAVKNRDCAIPPLNEPELHTYIGGIIKKNDHFPIAIGGTDNHVHVLLNYQNINQSIPDLARNIKCSSSHFFNERRFIKCRFEWQRGYACVSYSHSQIDAVAKYIRNQHEHHHHETLENEIRNMLRKFDIEFDDRYIIREVDA